jgi:hypothetical protein
MFVRIKKSGPRQYLQVVESYWEEGATKQRVIATLGRLDHLQAQGDIDGLLKSLSRFSEHVKVTKAYSTGHMEARSSLRIGPSLVFERLWKETGISSVLQDLLRSRRFQFPVERAVFLSVLNRLFAPGSDRQADRWREDYRIEGTDDLDLHHLYRAMGWLGETRKQIEERLFARRRNLFTKADLVFFDTTSIYFEGLGGETLGQYGHSKDHRPDRRQMVVGAVMDSDGLPISAPMWPGNQADVKTLLPLVEDLRARFGIRQMSVVADRGMVSKKTIQELEKIKPPIGYILGARMRKTNEVKKEVLGRGGRFREVGPNLHVKEVMVGKTRYVVCLNPEEAAWDAHVRLGILKSLRAKLKEGVSGLIGNRGYRRFLKIERNSVEIDEAKVKGDARFDGKWVLRTNLDLPAEEVALRYKELWRVERLFRNVKSLLSTRPIFHHYDATICGHVFVSFLALMLLHELDVRQDRRKEKAEWSDIRRDLEALQEIEVIQNGKRYWLRTPFRKAATAACRAVGVAIPPSIREA